MSANSAAKKPRTHELWIYDLDTNKHSTLKESPLMRDLAGEFETIDLLENSQAETRGVDSFALAMIKVERQLRKLFTFLIFQNPRVQDAGVRQLRDLLCGKRIYSSGIICGLNKIAPKGVAELVGPDHDRLFAAIKDATNIRNKIFHGQVTDQRLNRHELFQYVHLLRLWCTHLAESAETCVGYDGLGDNSYRQSTDPTLPGRLKRRLNSVEEYEELLNEMRKVRPF